MRRFSSYAILSFFASAAALAYFGCNPDTTTNGYACGPGTALDDKNECIPVQDTGTTGDAPATPPTFSGVKAVATAGATSLLVTWDPATDAVTPASKMVYLVYASNAPGAENFHSPLATSAPGATHISINGLAPAGSTWYIVVQARNEAGLTDGNNLEKSAQAIADTTPPTFGGATAAAGDIGGAVKISWDPPATDDKTPPEAIEYVVYESDNPIVSYLSPVTVSDPGATSVVVKGLPDPKATYYFAVRARDAAGNLERNTKVVSSKPGADTTPPVFSGCKAAIAKDATSITVTWAAATDDVSPPSAIAYDVYASTTAGGEDFATPKGSFTGVLTGVVTGLTPGGQTWYLVCRAKDASGNEEKNVAEVSATTPNDTTPPTFAGITSVSDVASDKATLHWTPADDGPLGSSPSDIVYVVYQRDSDTTSTYPTTPAATSKPGVTSIDVTGLSSATNYCWKVHAKDTAGNEDANTAEKCAPTQVSFDKDIQTPTFSVDCAVTGCHTGATPTGGMVLAAGFAYSQIVGVTSNEVPSMKRIAPGDLANSYMYQKITGHPAAGTSVMPPISTGTVLTDKQKNAIMNWILAGAPNN